MKKKINILIGLGFLLFLLTPCKTSGQTISGAKERAYFVNMLTKIADPVLENLSKDQLKENMPVEKAVHPYGGREDVTHLEALGRTLAGMAPWLELGPDDTEEGKLREKYIRLALKGIKNAVDPDAKDYMNFTKGGQPLVDAAFLAEALIRAPNQLWERLDSSTQHNIIKEFKKTRDISPYYMNWLLFSATIEAALLKFEGKADMVRLEYALFKHDEWYLGDGIYGDGPDFHWDYYNSYVIQPMMLDILSVLKEKKEHLKHWVYKNKFINQGDVFLDRAQRYAAVQERLISPEGTFPPIGRSLAYRCGAFQLLSQIALKQQLPDNLNPAQVRSALYAVIKKQMEAPQTFDEMGWLTIGFYGHQKEIAEPYISTGSLYLCTAAFLVLGLPEQTLFWAAPSADWTQKSVWGGGEAPIDHAYYPNQLKKEEGWETVIDNDSFEDIRKFKANWNYFYPWGNDHNGSARMYRSQVKLENNSLHLKASPVAESEGKSSSPPHLAIKYRSGAIHAKHQIKISKEHPEYTVSGEFKAPTGQGTWPAFWLTAVDGWPPESDILEFKGDAINWQNTFITPNNVTTIKRTLKDASDNWHTYSVKLKYIDDEHTSIIYYIDGEQTGIHYTNFTNKPLWLIINLQMEGSSGEPGPNSETSYFARNVTVKRKLMNEDNN
ncbi:DUF2264 domain-containing protein [Galbibacter sp. EGI 63066]|uniref:DUF2264 domain-containing protein n=1 Tax=Galbibacter sp. EGI 63066 TaxID=2993559 RepID=UPI00224969D2|nr:DUF2264 domain-containing protein [Galbibacter sp. EGI 63066]MCX2678677.1 DUF2264 domain-containing protein [Galbibacter sp. EGI 63066]